ncbi:MULTISPECIES: hypothetical protein [unclassified Shewanella]|uniref:hypothetical protein n=1 Tax=unclassified Shewanella TaxID=196818 RepID=UPI0022BA1400|nr:MULTISPECIES: hypothetical protein [unclassified Shewanella]MEC4737109.1 hypothetical protein [Shewanella sp. E94]WBJ95699.1 hypothetical protein HWQ47_00750 [Shewanella sp. MTB7]
MTISLIDFISLLLAVMGTIIAIVVPIARHHAQQMELIRLAIEQNKDQMNEFKSIVAEHYCKKQDLDKFAEQINRNMEKQFQHFFELIELKIQRKPS